ncbi:unnamed protein product, partial [Ixodes pacificus]
AALLAAALLAAALLAAALLTAVALAAALLAAALLAAALLAAALLAAALLAAALLRLLQPTAQVSGRGTRLGSLCVAEWCGRGSKSCRRVQLDERRGLASGTSAATSSFPSTQFCDVYAPSPVKDVCLIALFVVGQLRARPDFRGRRCTHVLPSRAQAVLRLTASVCRNPFFLMLLKLVLFYIVLKASMCFYACKIMRASFPPRHVQSFNLSRRISLRLFIALCLRS